MDKVKKIKVVQTNFRFPFTELEKQIQLLNMAREISQPKKGWINIVRISLKLPPRILASKFKTRISMQTVYDLETSEANGAISINSLRRAAEALGMQLVYGFVPKKENTIKEMLSERARKLATEEIAKEVNNTSGKFDLNNKEQKDRIEIRTRKILQTIPKSFWKEE